MTSFLKSAALVALCALASCTKPLETASYSVVPLSLIHISVHIVTGKEMGTVWEQVEAIVHKYAWSDCDTQRPILRKEFAVLADELCNPFARAVNIKGESD